MISHQQSKKLWFFHASKWRSKCHQPFPLAIVVLWYQRKQDCLVSQLNCWREKKNPIGLKVLLVCGKSRCLRNKKETREISDQHCQLEVSLYREEKKERKRERQRERKKEREKVLLPENCSRKRWVMGNLKQKGTFHKCTAWCSHDGPVEKVVREWNNWRVLHREETYTDSVSSRSLCSYQLPNTHWGKACVSVQGYQANGFQAGGPVSPASPNYL